MMRRVRQIAAVCLLLAVSTAAATSPFAAAASGLCPSAPANTLSFSCDNACPASQPCMSSSSACTCFDVAAAKAKDTPKRMRFLIPFGAYKSEEEKAAQATPSEVVVGADDTTVYASASNDEINHVDKWTLPSNVTGVIIRGGNDMTAYEKHRVANVSFDPQFLTAMTDQVRYLELENLAIGASIDKMVGNFPFALTALSLQNNLIKKFPANLQNLAQLRYLWLGYNDIETISKTDKMTDLEYLYLRNNQLKSFNAVFPKLQALDLSFNYLDGVPAVIAQHTNLKTLFIGGSDNTFITFNESHVIKGLETLYAFDCNMETFDATFPNLKSLDLSDNNLKAIPPKIFKMPKLESLGLTYSKLMLNVSLTNAQANFIYNLKEFTIDASSLRTDCNASQKYEFTNLNVTMCLSEPKNVTLIEGPRVIPVDDPLKSAGSPSGSRAGSAAESGAGGTTFVTPTKKGSSSTTPVIIGSVVGALLSIAIIVAIVMKKRRSNFAKATDMLTGDTVTGPTGNASSLWSDQDLLSLKVSVDDVQDIKKLGSGAFADVWLVRFRNAELMASKRLRESTATRSQVQGFIDEIKLVSTLKHPSVVELKGVAWIRESDLQALFEYMDSGDLRDYLTNPSNSTDWNQEKLQIAVDIAEALVYVHSFMPPLVHRDLKSRNVLLNGEMNAKLTDFGVSRYQSEQNTMTAGVGTVKWLAPEVISGDGNYGPAADIFSFGVLLYELDTHDLPYSTVRSAEGYRLTDFALMQLVSTGELTPEMSASCPSKIAELARLCFAFAPADRPTALEVAYALRTIKKNLASLYI